MANPANYPPRRPKGSYSLKVHSGGRITIPVDVRRYFRMEPGARIQLIVRRNMIYIKKIG